MAGADRIALSQIRRDTRIAGNAFLEQPGTKAESVNDQAWAVCAARDVQRLGKFLQPFIGPAAPIERLRMADMEIIHLKLPGPLVQPQTQALLDDLDRFPRPADPR